MKRSEKVHVRAQDRYGKEFELDADGLLAICIQHELDHLDGKLFIDYLPQFKKDRALKLMRKIEKEERERKESAEWQAPGRIRLMRRI